MRRPLFFLLRISVSLILIFFLFKFIDFSQLIIIISQANPFYLFFAFSLFLFSYILGLFRWKMLLEAIGLNVPLKRIMLSYLLSLSFNLFLPSTIGGDLARSIDLAIHTKRREDVLATVFLDRLSGYFGLLAICLVSLILGCRLIQQPSIYLAIGILFILFLSIILILFNRTIFEITSRFLKGGSKRGSILKELHSKIYYFKEKPKIIIKNLALSVLIQLVGPMSCYILAIAFNQNLSLIYFLVIIPIVGAVAMLPITFGGLGIRDLSMVFFFSQIDISLKDTAFAISLLIFFFCILIGLFGGILYVFTFHSRWLQFDKKDT